MCVGIGLIGAGVFKTVFKEDSAIVSQVELMPKTWSAFSEIKHLQMLIEGLNIQTLLDIPCCDIEAFTLLRLPLKYIGVANKKAKALALQAQFGGSSRVFLHRNETVDPLPKADVILCWDKLCALKTREVKSALIQFKKSGATFLLMRQYPEVAENKKNEEGQFQPINWRLAPYHFPEPLIQIAEKKANELTTLSLWNLENLTL